MIDKLLLQEQGGADNLYYKISLIKALYESFVILSLFGWNLVAKTDDKIEPGSICMTH